MARETFADTRVKPPKGMSYAAAEKMGLLRVQTGPWRKSPPLKELNKYYAELEKETEKKRVTW